MPSKRITSIKHGIITNAFKIKFRGLYFSGPNSLLIQTRGDFTSAIKYACSHSFVRLLAWIRFLASKWKFKKKETEYEQ